MNRPQVSTDIIFFAFRYALGRHTYAPSLVIEAVKENISLFEAKDLNQMIGEIRLYLDEVPDNKHETYPYIQWVEFKQYLQEWQNGKRAN